MPTKHYRYGGSTAARLIGCPAWVRLAESMPHKTGEGNPYADAGTVRHDAMEAMLLGNVESFDECVGMKHNDQVLDEDAVIDELEPLLDAYDQFAEDNHVEDEYVEVESNISDEIGGTLDLVALTPTAVCAVDWKFGHGIVAAENNAQLLFYLMCMRDNPKTKHFFDGRDELILAIGQPARLSQGFDEILDTWTTDLATLDAFTRDYQAALEKARAGTSDPCAGSHCKFCPAQPVCPEKLGLSRKALMLDPASLEAEILATGLTLVDELEEWCKTVRKTAHEQAELGMQIQGFKLVQRRANRQWTDEAAVIDKVKKSKKLKIDEVTTHKMASPAQLEKICKRLGLPFDSWCDYIERRDSGTTLVPDSDQRPAIPAPEAFAAALRAMDD